MEELKNVENALTSAKSELKTATNLQELDRAYKKYLGKKGVFAEFFKMIRTAPPEVRRALGEAVNRAKREIEETYRKLKEEIRRKEYEAKLKAEAVDVTLPGIRTKRGHLNPITLAFEEVIRIFEGMGFEVAEGPEVETDFYNFEALNIPPHHPAREMHDTFYLPGGFLLRTHTSPVQIRVMEKRKPPIRILAPGKVFRRDYDATHSPVFHQLEGLAVDVDITLTDLKGVLEGFVHRFFGPQYKARFRPSYFPFTEPSFEVDICAPGSDEWLEILGAGMVHPAVLRVVGYDPEIYQGFAFGLGIERMAMLKYGIDDIRLFYSGDVRFLSQF